MDGASGQCRSRDRWHRSEGPRLRYAPAEVEKALIDHPKIADGVVVGLRDREWVRRVHAIIEPTDPANPSSLEDVRFYAKRRMLPHKVPKSVEFVDAIPRSAATR